MPTAQQVVVDVTLTNFVRNYRFERHTFISDIIAPVVPVTSFKGRWKALGKELLDIHVDDTGAEDAETNRISYDASETTYECIERRLKTFVSDRSRKNSPNKLQPFQQAAITVLHALKLRQEKRLVDYLVAATTSSGYESTPSNDWDHADATIVADVNGGISAMVNALGFEPNYWVLPDHVSREIVTQADIDALFQAAAATNDPLSMLNKQHAKALPKQMFGMETLIPTALYNSAAPGAALSVARVWGDDSYLFSVGPPGTGATWGVQPQATGYTIVRIRQEDPAGWWVKAVVERDEVQVTPEAVHRFIDVT